MAENKIVNTSAQDPLVHLLAAMQDGGTGKSIEASEARGQEELIASDVLPAKGADPAILARIGIEVLGPVEGDPLFLMVKLPSGWTKRPTSHPMWSELYDHKGRLRAHIFYKAAYYDRKAHMDFERRYRINCHYVPADKPEEVVVTIRDAGQKVCEVGRYGYMDFDAEVGVRQQAEAYMTARWPQYKDPTAYWD